MLYYRDSFASVALQFTRNGVFYKDLYKDALLQDLHNVEQSVQS